MDKHLIVSIISDTLRTKYSVIKEISNNRGTYVLKISDEQGEKYALKYTSGTLSSDLINDSVKLLENETHFVLENKEFTNNIYVSHGSIHEMQFLLTKWINAEKSILYFEKILSTKNEEALKSVLLAILNKVFALHALGYLHGDLQPNHIYIGNDGSIYLLDFGLTHRINSNFEYYGGLAHFNSPELCQNIIKNNFSNLDVVSEIYSLGAVLFFLITKKTLVNNKSANETRMGYSEVLLANAKGNIKDNTNFELKEKEVGKCIRDIILKCVENDRTQRYQSLNQAIIDTSKCLALDI